MSGSSGGYCPICGKSYGPEADRCPVHGFQFQGRDALRPGVVIDGKFEILERLGAGGMGETYLVRHAYLGETLVLKRVRPELAEDPVYQQSFLREARSLAALRKLPAVVEIRDAWQTSEGYLALLLEYVEGGNLLQWLDTERGGGPLKPLEAVAVAAELAKALAAAHAAGVLHRDVKPQNILMRPLEGGGFQLKLCDFGLAVQRVEEMSRQGTTTTRFGTPGYAAPEQYALPSREQDARVDVFGLGMTLYRLVAGRLPWEANATTWPLVCTEQRRKSLKDLRPELEREYWLENLLLRLTAVERNDRIATAAEALELMQEALAETRLAPAVIITPQPHVKYERGRGVVQDDAQAVAQYRKAAETGDPKGMKDLGWMYEQGRGVARDDAQAVDWYRRAADKGHSGAMTNLGKMYGDGRGVVQNHTQAVAWFRKAAEAGEPLGMNNLGVMYRDGQGVAQDDARAAGWFRKAAEGGYAGGMYNLGLRYRDGRGVAQDDTQAFAWFGRAAEKGDALGMTNLGKMYRDGRGVAQDDTQAVVWYRKAAEKGEPYAMNDLGLMYADGRGVAQDDAEAVAWYRKAAESGSAAGMTNLGVMYADGRGVARDLTQAAAWYRKAAENGEAGGMTNLGAMYEQGTGVVKNMVEALAWYRRAAMLGTEEAKANLKRLCQ